MRSKRIAGVLAVIVVVLITAPGHAGAADMAPLALNDRTGASAPTAAEKTSWYERAWRRVREAFGVPGGTRASWMDSDLNGSGPCAPRGCSCCHSPIMVPRNVDGSFVHPSPPGSTENIDGLYLRSAKAISQMNAREREQVRRKLRSAISDEDASRARALIDATVAKAPASAK